MSASMKSTKQTFRSSGVIAPNTFVKFGATKDVVAKCGLNERAIGISANDASTVDGDVVEVVVDGGAHLKVSETVALGKMITSTANGEGEVADAAGEWVGALAYEDGLANDVIGVKVVGFQAVASDA